MRILFVTNEVPYPPDNGVRIVSHHAMRLMQAAGHELALAVLSDERDDPGARFGPATAPCVEGMSFWSSLPSRHRLEVQCSAWIAGRLFFVERYRSEAFRRRLVALIAAFRPDVIHYDIITLAQYVDTAPPGVGTVASVNDSHALTLQNALADGSFGPVERLYRQRQFHQVRRYEADWYPRFGTVHVMSEVDARYLRQLNPAIHCTVVANGVDDALFDLATAAPRPADVIFVGKLVGDNLQGLSRFLRESWPLVRARCPHLKLKVVGRIGPEAAALAERMRPEASVQFTGYLEQLAAAYQSSGIAIAPNNKNCGIINKAIEAMAAGLAVVGFEKTFAGLEGFSAGVHGVGVRDYETFAGAIIELAQDEARRSLIQQAARSFTRLRYAWSTRGEAYQAMYRRAAEAAQAARMSAGARTRA